MADARVDQQWNHTAALLAMLVNVNRDPKKGRAMKPGDFHPGSLKRSQNAPVLKGDLQMLKSVFVDKR